MHNDQDRVAKARSLVFNYAKAQADAPKDLSLNDVALVWFSKTLRNWKAMVTVLKPGNIFFEVTHNGDNGDTYLDVYKKIENVRYSDEQ